MEWEAEAEMKKGNFPKAREMFESLLGKRSCKSKEKSYLLGKADTLALEGRLSDALPVYCEAFKRGTIQPDRLLRFITGLIKVITIENNSFFDNEDTTILQCGICTGVLYEPVTVSCGHSFCKLCLEKQEAKKCSHCDKPFSSGAFRINVILQDILEKSFQGVLEATRLRFEGNQLHKRKQSLQAIDKYKEAEKLNKSDHLIQSNLACVLLSLGYFEEALARASKTCELQPAWPKGYYRKGCALVGLNKKTEAAVAFLHCLARDPGNKGVEKSLAKLIHELIVEAIPRSSSKGDHHGHCASEETDPILHRLKSLVNHVEQSKMGPTMHGEANDSCEDEPDIKKLRLGKQCSVEDLECTLCCRLFYEPVTTPCGHVFCRCCLNCNLDHRPTCPICRYSLSKFLAERNQNITAAVSRLIESALPEEHEERKKLHEEEMEKLASVARDTTEDVPIFVCTLAFPSQPCPLHIFEPRYRLMVRQCMESGSKQFGMCVHDEDKGFVDYGVMLEINDLQYLPDGRSFLDCVGGRRFKVIERGIQNGYHTAKVEWIKDEPIPPEELDEIKALHERVYNDAKSWFANLPLLSRRRITNMFSEMPSCDTELVNLPQGPQWIWWLLSICPLPEHVQLQFLAMACLKTRLEKLQELFASFQRYT
ncbi:unnamed protein product [Porites evermanni]|uniref:LON peptidase N-terminal domain and RING finger protein 3 n=1 Tax=Porites evermanni TaxID=104178 RepID=A0ABN8Q1G1_9CNID|nr:unnamed protein product [Porites evermanni]